MTGRVLAAQGATGTADADFEKLARTLGDLAMKVFAALPLLLERRAAAE